MRKLFPLFLLVLMVSSACKRTQALYEKGEYDRAVFNSVERLRSSPNNKKARETLRSAYPALVDYRQGEVAQELQTANPLRWERVMAHYEVLARAHDEIKRSPAASRVIPSPQDFTRPLTEATRNAAEARYALGEREIARAERGDRVAAKDAYQHFLRANELRPGYRDARNRADYARDLATVFVEIEPIPMHSRSFSLSNEFFQNQIIEFATHANLGPFIEFYAAGERRSNRPEPDHILRMRFDEFVVGQAYVKEREADRSKDNVVVREIKVNEDSVRKVYGTVKAKVTLFEKQIKSSGLLDVQIVDAHTGSIVSQRKFPGTHVWVDRWGYMTGDKRAITDEDKDFLRKRRESAVPGPQQLFTEFTRPIYDQVTGFVSNYYRGI